MLDSTRAPYHERVVSREDTGVMRRAKRREETTKRILDAAMGLMASEGYEVFTIARLAKELDYAVGALYRYFKGKDAILAALQVRVVDQIAEDLGECASRIDEAAQARSWDEASASLAHVLGGIGVYESLSHRRPTDHRLLTLSLGDPRELLTSELVDAGVLPPLRKVLGVVASRIDTAVEKGALQPGDSAARVVTLWGGTQGLMQLRKLDRVDTSMSSRGLTDTLICGLLRGWGATVDVDALQGLVRPLVDELSRES